MSNCHRKFPLNNHSLGVSWLSKMLMAAQFIWTKTFGKWSCLWLQAVAAAWRPWLTSFGRLCAYTLRQRGVMIIWLYITEANKTLLRGISLKFTILLPCLIPPEWSIRNPFVTGSLAWQKTIIQWLVVSWLVLGTLGIFPFKGDW